MELEPVDADESPVLSDCAELLPLNLIQALGICPAYSAHGCLRCGKILTSAAAACHDLSPEQMEVNDFLVPA